MQGNRTLIGRRTGAWRLPEPVHADAQARALAEGAPIRARTLVLVAHPDDECVGAASRLRQIDRLVVAYATDGAPPAPPTADPAANPARVAAAATRASEARSALELAGCDRSRLRSLGFIAEETSFLLPDLVRAVSALFAREQPELVLTHPYEGGHPDHDAVAFAVHAACARLRQTTGAAPAIVEMASYHRLEGRLITGTFLPRAGHPEYRAGLDDEVRALRNAVLDRHQSKSGALAPFREAGEAFRAAPAIEFRTAPHAGPLNYEHEGWRLEGAAWRALAERASLALAIP